MELVHKYLSVDKRWFVLALLVMSLSTLVEVRAIIFLAAFCMLNALLLLYDRYVQLPIDIELSTFAAVLMAVRFGLWWGIAAGILTKVVAMINNRDFSMSSLVSISSYVLAAVLASMLKAFPIFILGIIVIFAVNLFSFFALKLMMLSNEEVIMYSASNFIFNLAVFAGFAEIMMRITSI
jgi:thiamine transporter ThiT